MNDRSFYDVPSDKIVLWRETYPAVDVEQELRRMIAWLDSNPTKRKTRRGIERFVNNWLARTQDSGGSKGRKEVSEAVGNNAYNTDGGGNEFRGRLMKQETISIDEMTYLLGEYDMATGVNPYDLGTT